MLSVEEPFVFDGISSKDKLPDEGRKIIAHWFYGGEEWYGVFRVKFRSIVNIYDESFHMFDDYFEFEWRYLEDAKTSE